MVGVLVLGQRARWFSGDQDAPRLCMTETDTAVNDCAGLFAKSEIDCDRG